ncbi:hypothetical protein P885DRAFT_73877 [Corynascus similis CBS 632.67]
MSFQRLTASSNLANTPPLLDLTCTISGSYSISSFVTSDQGALTEATRTYDATPICVVSESSIILPTCSAPTEAVAGEPTEAPPPDKWLTSSNRGGTTVEAHHFVAAVLPTLLAVLFAIPFHIIHLHAASLEPFHQLTVSSRRRDGATLSRSLLADYTSFSALSALVPGLTFTLVYVAAILAPLAAEAWEIALFGTCAADESDGCVPVMRAIPQLVRALEGVLAFVVILAGLLVLALRNWTPGVMADPRSVLGIAALAHEPGVAELFRQLRGDGVGLKEMKTRVGGLRAALGTFVAPAGHDAVILAPFLALSRSRPSTADDSILLPYASDPYSNFVRSIRRGDLLLAAVSLATISSDPLPVSLANVPFNRTRTFATHVVCSWISIGVLMFMVFVLAVLVVVVMARARM